MHDQQIMRFVNLGVVAYNEALEIQEQLRQQVLAEKRDSHVLFVEHPAVLTMGKNADSHNLLSDLAKLHQSGVAIHHTDRGGQVTAHEPGQLVMYPILSISRFKLTPRKYVCLLEKAVIAALDRFGISGHSDPEHPGIWVGNDKICAIGVRIKDRVTMHGIALNVTNNMHTFEHIIPCGIRERGITSISQQLNEACSLAKVREVLAEEFAKLLDCQALLQTFIDCSDRQHSTGLQYAECSPKMVSSTQSEESRV